MWPEKVHINVVGREEGKIELAKAVRPVGPVGRSSCRCQSGWRRQRSWLEVVGQEHSTLVGGFRKVAKAWRGAEIWWKVRVLFGGLRNGERVLGLDQEIDPRECKQCQYVEPSTSQLEVPLRGLPRSWREGDYLVSRYPDGSAGMRLGAQEEIRLTPRTLFAEALMHFRLEVGWLRKRLDQMAAPLELPVARDQLEKVGKEIEEMEEVVRRLKDKKEGLVLVLLLELPVARDQLEKVGKEIEEMEEVVR
ncbi:hypothetical protein RHSIM_Rhsim12G0194500 [Rhododendron simsii]|uniref:Uncharacterized protein n=1 Tax=Rhododendron simsii TaxID=118357 RepID=A0A834L5S6_RHOSS|nr:hypothetical protein RHSIM_Rhsim12G0194500 [Rhododendron simsii]